MIIKWIEAGWKKSIDQSKLKNAIQTNKFYYFFLLMYETIIKLQNLK